MFTVEVANNSRTYRAVSETEVADNAIYFFIDALDKVKPADSIRIVADGETMARRTPKGNFIHKDWK